MSIRFKPIRFPIHWTDLNLQSLLRLVIVVAVLFLSAYLARGNADKYLPAILGVVAGLILIRWPHWGLLGLIAGTLVVPFSIGTGSQTPLNVPALLIPVLVALWVAEMIRTRNVHLKSSRTNLPMFALALSATASLIAGSQPWNLFARTAPLAAQIGGWVMFVLAAGVYLLVGNQISDQRWLKICVALFLGIGSLYMAGRFSVPLFNGLSTMMNRMGSDGSMFWAWLVALATGQLLFNRTLNRPIQLGLGVLVAATLYVGWFLARSWTSGYLPSMVAVGVLIWLRSWRMGLLATAVAGAVFFLSGHADLLSSLVGSKSYSILTRDVARDILVNQVFPLSPILGLGPANYFWYTPLYPILGWYVKFNSHNNYVDILVQTGLVGLLCFFWVFFEVAWLAWRLRDRFANDFAQGYAFACLGGVAGTLVSAWLADWVIPFAYNIGLTGFRASILAWFFMGGLVSLEEIARQPKTEDTR